MNYYNNEPVDPADKFLKKYEATSELSRNRMYAKRPEYHYGRMKDFDYYNTTASFQLEREPCVEINIPQHRFKQLVEQHQYYEELENDWLQGKAIVKRHLDDELIRNKNEVVKKAWEKYKMLLELIR